MLHRSAIYFLQSRKQAAVHTSQPRRTEEELRQVRRVGTGLVDSWTIS